MYNIKLEAFCEQHSLGTVIESHLFPKGMTNRTYLVVTTVGKYVVKAINPKFSNTKEKRNRLVASELLAEIAYQSGISSVSAIRIKGDLITKFCNQYYMVFNFCEGEMIVLKNITVDNCAKIGKILAEIHQLNFTDFAGFEFPRYSYGWSFKKEINWDYYIKTVNALEEQPKWAKHFGKRIDILYDMFAISQPVFKKFKPQNEVISHGDIFHQNILWQDEVPHIIDWEKSSVIDATFECLNTAIRWSTESISESKDKIINMEKFYAFLGEYLKVHRIEIEQLDVALHMVWYRKLVYFRSALKLYLKPQDETERHRASRKVRYTLTQFKSHKELAEQLPAIKSFIIQQQPSYYRYYHSKTYRVKVGIRDFGKALLNKLSR